MITTNDSESGILLERKIRKRERNLTFEAYIFCCLNERLLQIDIQKNI